MHSVNSAGSIGFLVGEKNKTHPAVATVDTDKVE